jgi:hypothetical protein
LHNNGAAHAAEFEEGELDAFLNGIPKLRAPACIAVCSEAVVLVLGGGNSVSVCFCIQRWRKQHEGVEGFPCGRSKRKAIVDHRVDIM